MGVLTSGSWTVAYRTDRIYDEEIGRKKRQVHLKLTTVSGTLPVGSKLPLPGAVSVGMVRSLERYIFDRLTLTSGEIGAAASGNAVLTYNATGNSVTFYRVPNPGVFASGTGRTGIVPLVTGANIKALTFYVTALGW